MALLTDSCLGDVVAIVVTIAAIVYAYFKWNYQYWKRKGMPYFEPSIPFGNMPNPVTTKLSPPEHMKKLYDEGKAKGYKYCGAFFIGIPALMVIDLELLKKVMTKDFTHFVDRGVIYTNEKDDPLSGNLFALGGIKWKNLRAKLTPTFTSGKMKMMFHTIAECGVILEKYIDENLANKDVVDIKEVLARFSTDVIGSCAFGLECNSFKDPDTPFRKYGKKVLENSPLQIVKILLATTFPKAANALGVRALEKDVADFYYKVVEDTILYRRKNNVTRNDFLQLLMDMLRKDSNETGDGNTLTMDELAAQCFVFFIAGFETSSTTMTFALFELAQHQDMQDKVREEIRTVLAKHDNKITYDSMNDLVYMRQVIDETLRMYPPVGLLTRECSKEYTIPGEDVVIEKGTTIFIPVTAYHYDEEYFPNSKVFDPERFNAENKQSINQYAYIPFGEGPRICIGERFGIMQTKVGLTSLLKDFKITLDKKTNLPLKIDPRAPVTAAEGGIWLRVEKV